MGINATVARMENGGWRFTWPVGTAPYPIYFNGELLATAEDEEYEFVSPGKNADEDEQNFEDHPPDLEILNDGEASESLAYPPILQLQWRGVLGVMAYVVDQLISSNWVSVSTQFENGQGYYWWRTPAHGDGEALQFRVRAVNLAGDAGTAIEFTQEIVRNPEAPEVVFTIDSGDLVVSEA